MRASSPSRWRAPASCRSRRRKERVVGGHAVLAVGYSDPKGQLTVRNSWGSGWGDQGYFYMPYEYLTGPGKVADASVVNGGYLASDFWAVQKTA